jgi:hypothetical protein
VSWLPWLIEAAGDPDRIVALVSEFSTLYQSGSVRTEVHHVISQGNLGAARWTMTGRFANGGHLENEYTLVEERGGLVSKAWEHTDIAHSAAQMRAAANQG